MMIAKAGRPERAPSNMSSIPTRRRKGVRKLRPSRRTRFRKLPRCYSFSNHAVSSPPMMAAKMHDDPQVGWEMTPWYWCWWWAPWELPRLLGVSPLPLHTPGVQCCTKRARQRNLIASEYSCVRGLQNQILHNQVDPEKHFLGNSVFHSPRLHRHGVEWRGSLIKTEFKPGALKNLLSCRSSDYNVVDSVFPEYKSWGVLLASWPQTWSIQAFLYGEEQS